MPPAAPLRPSWLKRVAPALALLVPTLAVGLDLWARADRVPQSGWLTYGSGAALSLAVWGLVMEAARHPRRLVRGVALFVLGTTAAFGLGLQAVVLSFTHAYLGRRALLLALGFPDVSRSQYVAHYAFALAAACLVPAVLVVALAAVRRRVLGARTRRPTAFALAALVATGTAILAPYPAEGFQSLPPDVLFLHGTGGPLLYAFGLAERPRSLPEGTRVPLPETPPAPRDAPPIVVLFGESVRRDAMCLAPSADCAKNPRLDAAAPNRIGFQKAFTTASCTELASVALFSGRAVTTPPEVLAAAPLVWDYAKARGYHTAYLTSQNLLFQGSDRFLRGTAIDTLREGRDRVIDVPIDEGTADELLVQETLDVVEAEGPPPFVVVHFANTHAPYRQVAGFTPNPGDDRWPRYLNSLVHHDALVGELLEKLRAGPRGQRAIVLYTSDHGEAWGEHGAYYHSFDLYAEQLDVPLWLDAPTGTLPDGAEARLRREAPERPVFPMDLTATLLDLMGALETPSLARFTGALDGESLLREAPRERAVLLWNCPPMRECATDAFGVLAYPRKLHYVGHRSLYACHDLAVDPKEQSPLPADECADLRARVDEAFGVP
jgi:glucan phosphoethanolaminetransferase (alkaline phosphatase superfamily)